MFSSYDIEKINPKFLPLTTVWKYSMKNQATKGKPWNMNIKNNQIGLYHVQPQLFLQSIDKEDNKFKIKPVFSHNQQQKEEATGGNFNRLAVFMNKERTEKTTAMLGKEPGNFAKVILEDGREFFQEDEEEMNKGKVIYRRKLPTSYGRHQQRLQQRRQRKILQEIHLSGGRQSSQSCYQQKDVHRHHLFVKSHQKEHQQFYVAKSFLGQPQKQFQERVQRRQAALFIYRQWQLQIHREFEDLEKIHQNIISSEPRVMKKGNMVVRPIRMGFQKIVRRPSIIRERKKGEVKMSELRKYLNLLETDIVSSFLERDSCYRLSDKYLLAATFVYFKRAGYPLEKYTPRNFFVSLYLANDMEEDEEDLKYEIFPWAIGNDWPNRIQEFLKERDHLFQEIGQRGVVSRICCEEVMAIIPNSKIWFRNRLLHHAGGVRNSTLFINPTLDDSLSNPQVNNNGSGVYFNYCGIVEPVQPFLLAPDIAPIPCFLCHPELAPTPPKNCSLLSLVLRQNPSIQGQTKERDLQTTKVIRCFASSKSDSDLSASSSSDEDDELSFSDTSILD